MFTEKDFEVTLLNPEEVKQFIKKHGEFACVCYNTPIERAEGTGLHCLKSGHVSGSRHVYFVFRLKNIPRFTVDQLVRHEGGVVKNVMVKLFTRNTGDFFIQQYFSSQVAV